MRLLIIIGLLYLLFRVVKKKIGDFGASSFETPTDEIDDIMVKDPICETHIPRRESIHVRHRGEDYFFCSPECRDRFVALKEK